MTVNFDCTNVLKSTIDIGKDTTTPTPTTLSPSCHQPTLNRNHSAPTVSLSPFVYALRGGTGFIITISYQQQKSCIAFFEEDPKDKKKKTQKVFRRSPTWLPVLLSLSVLSAAEVSEGFVKREARDIHRSVRYPTTLHCFCLGCKKKKKALAPI